MFLSPYHMYAQLTAHDLITSVVLNKACHCAISSVLLSHVFKYSPACFNHQCTVSPSFIVREKFQISKKEKLQILVTFQVIVLLVILVMRKRIKLVIQLFKEAGKAINSMPLLLLEPLLVSEYSLILKFYCRVLSKESFLRKQKSTSR